jgi:OOP family OmpA-OmpF porin
MKQRYSALVGVSIFCSAVSGAWGSDEYVTESGPYIGASIGSATYEEDLDDVAPGLQFEESDTGWKVFGGYRFMRYIGVDLAYTDLGKPEDNLLGVDASIEIDGWNLSGVGYLPLGRWEFFGGLGVFFWDGEAKLTDGVTTVTDDDSGEDLSTRLGGSFAITKALRVRGEIESYDIGDYTSLFSVGLDYRF